MFLQTRRLYRCQIHEDQLKKHANSHTNNAVFYNSQTSSAVDKIAYE